MKNVKLKIFVNDVAHMSVGEICKQIGISENTLRHRWRTQEKRREVILLIAGYTAEEGAYVEKLMEKYY